MTWLLALNTLIEGITGIVMISRPAVFFPTADALTFAVAGTFGVAAAALAILSGAMLRIDRQSAAMTPGLVTLAFFHTAMAITLIPAVGRGFTPLPVEIIHALLAIAFIGVLIARTRRP